MRFKVTVETDQGLSVSENVEITADLVLILSKDELKDRCRKEVSNLSMRAFHRLVRICESGEYVDFRNEGN